MPFARLVLTALLWPMVFVGAVLCALAAGAAQLGRTRPAWDLLTHFAPLYLAAGVIALLACLMFHGPYRLAAMVAALACIIASLLLIAPEYLRYAGPQAETGAKPTFKLVQLNLWDGAGGAERAAKWLAAQDPDVVVVEECNPHVRDVIARQTGWQVVEGRNDVMIFTRHTPMGELIPVTDDDGPMNVVGATLPTPDGPVTILGVHYPWPTRPNLPAMTARLRQIVTAFPQATTILSGDFNSTPWSFARRRDDTDFGLIRRTRGLFSWPTGVRAPVPILPLDHVYAGPGWATVRVERGPDVGSDHYPVVVTLARLAHR
jgi:endonuclease/exonuclease/phosphatase (EEP) superfamily protein YafD